MEGKKLNDKKFFLLILRSSLLIPFVTVLRSILQNFRRFKRWKTKSFLSFVVFHSIITFSTVQDENVAELLFFHSHVQNGKLQLQVDGDGKCIDVNRRLKPSASTCRWMMSLRIKFHCRKVALRKVVNWKPSLQAQHNYCHCCLQHSAWCNATNRQHEASKLKRKVYFSISSWKKSVDYNFYSLSPSRYCYEPFPCS